MDPTLCVDHTPYKAATPIRQEVSWGTESCDSNNQEEEEEEEDDEQ